MQLKILNVFILFSLALCGTAIAAPPGNGTSGPATSLPASLRQALYQALGNDAENSAHRINSNGCAVLPRQAFRACFDADGAHFSSVGDAPLTLHLVAFGRGNMLSPIKPVPPNTHSNRASYRHGDLVEWWRVLPLGFEQGFTVMKRPSGDGKLTLALVANDRAARHQDVLTWGRLRYGGLVVTDAKGKVIPATLKNNGNRILIAVNDKKAIYPLTVDPLVWLEQEVTADDGAENDEFGLSVAVSGTTALVGAPFRDNLRGAVYVFTESNGAWTQTAELTEDNGADYDQFGISVALSGATALIGAHGYNTSQGTAYVFTESNGTWTQTAMLTGADSVPLDLFGVWVALDGTTALVGAPAHYVNGTAQGAAYVFTESNGTWTQTAELTASDGAQFDLFGIPVALDGTTALVGAAGHNNQQGAAYVFSGSSGWDQTAELTASDGAQGDYFGAAVALSGTTALVGAWGHSDAQGSVYEFNESGGAWNQTAEITANDGTQGNNFGATVALSGTTAIIGAYGKKGYKGAVYVFGESGDAWNQTAEITASDGTDGDYFGDSVALSGDTALVGARLKNNDQGAAYFYGESDQGLTVSAPETVGQGQQYVSQTIATNNASAASPAVSATITVPAAASFVSATASQGTCGEASGVVTCDFGQIDGNAGTATANVTLKATGDVGDTIETVAGVAKATPPLSASAPTTITAGGACPDGYTEYDGSLNAGQRTHSPIYQAPAGMENAILSGPSGFQLYAVFQNARYGRKIYRIPGNEVHRRAPAGYFTWVVKAGGTGGAYTLCLQHP